MMNTYAVLLYVAFATFMVADVSCNINICGDTGSCCPKNSSLKCCCQSNTVQYKASYTKVNFWSAFIACKEAGMDLATITSQAEENTLTAYLKSIYSAVGFGTGFWIGGSSLGTSPSWYWLKTGEPLVYSAFIPGQPDNGNAENCLHWLIAEANKTYGWNNLGCAASLNYVCQTRRECV